MAGSYPSPPASLAVGFAGGLGPTNLAEQVSAMRRAAAARGEAVWIDMESSLRDVDARGTDTFDLDRCADCVSTINRLVADGVVAPFS